MANVIQIVITADGKQVTATVKTTEKEIKKLGNTTAKAGKQTGLVGKQIAGLAKSVAGPLAAGAAFSFLASKVTESVTLAREQAKVEAQLETVLSSTGHAAGLSAKEITNMASALQQSTNFGDEATIAGQNVLLTFTNIGKDAFPRATAAMLDLSVAMGQGVKESAIQVGKALNDPVTGLTNLRRVGIQFTASQEEMIKTLASTGREAEAQNIILTELERQFGGSAAAAREADGGFVATQNSIGDLQEVIGGGLIPTMERLNAIVRKGAESWSFILGEAIPAINEYNREIHGAATGIEAYENQFADLLPVTEEVIEAHSRNAAQMAASTAATRGATLAQEEFENALQAQSAVTERWAGLAEASKQQLDELAGGHTKTAREAELYAEAQELAAEAESRRVEEMERVRDSLIELGTTQAGFINEFQELQADSVASAQEFNAQITGIQESAAEKRAEQASTLAEELAAIEQEKQERIHFIETGGMSRSAEATEALVQESIAKFEDLKTQTIASSKEKTDAIIAEEERAASVAREAREREKAELQAHLEELKLQTALSMLETTGELEQLTGLVGVGAGEAASLISSGLLPVSEELGLAIQGQAQSLESGMAAAGETATANRAIIEEALAGTLEQTALTDEQTLSGQTAIQQAQMLTQQNYNTLSAETLPVMQAASVTASTAATAGINTTTSAVQTTQSEVTKLGQDSTKAGDKVAKAFEKAADKIKSKLVPAMKEARSMAESLAAALERAASAARSAGSASSSAGLPGFQSGTQGRWLRVPGGRNQAFPVMLHGQELFNVIPAGSSSQNQTTNNNRTSNVNNYFNQTINTTQRTSGFGEFRVAQMILGT